MTLQLTNIGSSRSLLFFVESLPREGGQSHFCIADVVIVTFKKRVICFSPSGPNLYFRNGNSCCQETYKFTPLVFLFVVCVCFVRGCSLSFANSSFLSWPGLLLKGSSCTKVSSLGFHGPRFHSIQLMDLTFFKKP